MAKKPRSLDQIYADIPPVHCQGKCQRFCGPVPVHPAELARMGSPDSEPAGEIPGFSRITGMSIILPVATNTAKCPLLTDAGQCGIYADRPIICRLWGATDDMVCPHGCKPDKYLTRAEGLALADEAGRAHY